MNPNYQFFKLNIVWNYLHFGIYNLGRICYLELEI